MVHTPEYSCEKTESLTALNMSRFSILILVLSCMACVCVFVAGCSATAPSLLLQHMNTKEYKDLTYIKPFTSLVGFNGKFCKDQKLKPQRIKTPKLALPLLHW